MTAIKIGGKPHAAAAATLEERADWLFNNPGGRVVGVVELRHTSKTVPAPDTEKDKGVEVAITQLEFATSAQEETLRKVMRALFLQRTASGTLDVDGEIEMSKEWLRMAQGELGLVENGRLRAGIREWSQKLWAAQRDSNATVTSLRAEISKIRAGVEQLLGGTEVGG